MIETSFPFSNILLCFPVLTARFFSPLLSVSPQLQCSPISYYLPFGYGEGFIPFFFFFFMISCYMFESGYHPFLGMITFFSLSFIPRLNNLLKVIFVSIYPGSEKDEFVGSW